MANWYFIYCIGVEIGIAYSATMVGVSTTVVLHIVQRA